MTEKLCFFYSAVSLNTKRNCKIKAASHTVAYCAKNAVFSHIKKTKIPGNGDDKKLGQMTSFIVQQHIFNEIVTVSVIPQLLTFSSC